MKKGIFAFLISAGLMSAASAADITIAYSSDPVSMDPMELISEGTLQMANMVYEPLVRNDANLHIQPRLAESWEQISPTVMRFHLRKGVYFHSGNKMTAGDVIFSFDRLRNSVDFKTLYAPYIGMEKVDDHTVDLKMKKPYPLVLQNMTYLFVMDKQFFTGEDEKGHDKALIDKTLGTFASTHESGTGPFILQSRQQGVKSVYRSFFAYWDKTGNVRTVTLVPIKEDATRVAALLSGDVDWIYPVPSTDVKRIKKNDKVDFYATSSDQSINMQMNENSVPEFKDRRVREAVVNAVNNQAIVDKIMRGNASVASQNSPEGYAGHNDNLQPRYDLKKAKALMNEAGLEKGFTVSMVAPNNRYVNDEKVAQTVAAMLAKINIKVNLTTLPKAQYWTEFDKCQAGLLMMGWSSDTGDSANYSEFLTATKSSETGLGLYNCTGYSNPKLDKLIAASSSEVDPDKRTQLLQEISQIEYDDAISIPLYWPNQSWAYSKTFKNFPEIVNLKNFPHWEKLEVEEN